ncbi:DUF7268 family protein [Haloarchaeobius sp. DT45]|uniref:DUF7268 family protein n=1 Tax=Haloarchaeobius sp. DT45 TaxID=3446116 RepID=UPI003F6C5664
MDLPPRVRLVASAAGVGALVGAIGTLLVGVAGPGFVTASELVFAVGAVALGIGLLGWSGSIMVGDAVELRNERLGRNSDWTERKSRRAMARVGGFGCGVMVGSSVLATVAFAM